MRRSSWQELFVDQKNNLRVSNPHYLSSWYNSSITLEAPDLFGPLFPAPCTQRQKYSFLWWVKRSCCEGAVCACWSDKEAGWYSQPWMTSRGCAWSGGSRRARRCPWPYLSAHGNVNSEHGWLISSCGNREVSLLDASWHAAASGSRPADAQPEITL